MQSIIAAFVCAKYIANYINTSEKEMFVADCPQIIDMQAHFM